jgi:hypothetical protein
LLFRQTASLFYDQIKDYVDQDVDVLSVFQNYSHCFLGAQMLTKDLNLTQPKYRSIDGSENNMKNTQMGRSFTSFGRFLKSSYDDNIHSIRKSIRGYNLPSPRNIVRKLFLNDKINLNKFDDRKKIPNQGALMFGQLIAHDVSSKQSVQYLDGGDSKFLFISVFSNDHKKEFFQKE